VNEVLSRQFNTQGESLASNMQRYREHLKNARETVGRGSNRMKGSEIAEARRIFTNVGRRFRELAEIPKGSVQIHHAFLNLAKAPGAALDTTNLMLARGQAAVEGTTHQMAHAAKDKLTAAKRAKLPIGNPLKEAAEAVGHNGAFGPGRGPVALGKTPKSAETALKAFAGEAEKGAETVVKAAAGGAEKAAGTAVKAVAGGAEKAAPLAKGLLQDAKGAVSASHLFGAAVAVWQINDDLKNKEYDQVALHAIEAIPGVGQVAGLIDLGVGLAVDHIAIPLIQSNTSVRNFFATITGN